MDITVENDVSEMESARSPLALTLAPSSVAFFLAVAHVIITETLYDTDYAAEKLYGLDRLTEHVRSSGSEKN